MEAGCDPGTFSQRQCLTESAWHDVWLWNSSTFLPLGLVEAGSWIFESDCEAVAAGCSVSVTSEGSNICSSPIGPLFTCVISLEDIDRYSNTTPKHGKYIRLILRDDLRRWPHRGSSRLLTTGSRWTRWLLMGTCEALTPNVSTLGTLHVAWAGVHHVRAVTVSESEGPVTTMRHARMEPQNTDRKQNSKIYSEYLQKFTKAQQWVKCCSELRGKPSMNSALWWGDVETSEKERKNTS